MKAKWPGGSEMARLATRAYAHGQRMLCERINDCGRRTATSLLHVRADSLMSNIVTAEDACPLAMRRPVWLSDNAYRVGANRP